MGCECVNVCVNRINKCFCNLKIAGGRCAGVSVQLCYGIQICLAVIFDCVDIVDFHSRDRSTEEVAIIIIKILILSGCDMVSFLLSFQ